MKTTTTYYISVNGHTRRIDEALFQDLVGSKPSQRSMVYLSATVQELINKYGLLSPKYSVVLEKVETTPIKEFTMEPVFYPSTQ